MKPFVEFEGKNIDEAVENACHELKIKKEDLKYDVISSGSSGIFGLVGVKKAKIRVRRPLQTPSVAEEKKIPTSEVDKELDLSAAGVKSLVDEAFKEPATEKIQEKVQEKEAVLIPEGPVNFGKEALQRMVDLITTDATVTVESNSERVLYNISGGNSAVLIGKRGQTLEAMQYLVDKIVNKQSEARIRVQIDVEGYLESRKESLKSLAIRLAEKTKRTGKPSTISQMTAHDRRIVHLELKDDKGVRTQSIGDGYYRRLVIFPKKGSFRKKKQGQKQASKKSENQKTKKSEE